MSTRRIIAVLVCALIWAVPALGRTARRDRFEELARRLPADQTLLFASVETGQALQYGASALKQIDERAGGEVAFQLGRLYSLYREAGARHGFEPALLDRLRSTGICVVAIERTRPKVSKHKLRLPKLDPRTGKRIEGEFEEYTHSERDYNTVSLILRAPREEDAHDFVEQVRSAWDHAKEIPPDGPPGRRREIPVERGELVGFTAGPHTVGRIDNYVILSNDNPRELWKALMAPSSEPVLRDPLYRRLAARAPGTHARMLLNVRLMLRQWEHAVKSHFEDVRAQYEPPEEAEGRPQWSFAGVRLRAAYAALRGFVRARKLFGLEHLESVGGVLHGSAGRGKTSGGLKLFVAHERELPPVLEELLRGSGHLQPPPLPVSDSMVLMLRARIEPVCTALLRTVVPGGLGPGLPPVLVALGVMGRAAGLGQEETPPLAGSDAYAWVGVRTRELAGRSKEGRRRLVPEITLVWGLKDARAARENIRELFTQLSTHQSYGKHVKKRRYQQTDVWCFGRGVTRPESYPDGVTSFAIAAVGRYLAVGSWGRLTGLIRRTRQAPGDRKDDIRGILEQNREANLIGIVPDGFREQLRNALRSAAGAESEGSSWIGDWLRKAGPDLKDEELEGKIDAALEGLAGALETLGRKTEPLLPERLVISGGREDGVYEIRAGVELEP